MTIQAQTGDTISLNTNPVTYKKYDISTKKYFLLDENYNLLSSDSYDYIDRAYYMTSEYLELGNNKKYGLFSVLLSQIILPVEYKNIEKICCDNDVLVTKDSLEWTFFNVETEEYHFIKKAKRIEEFNIHYSEGSIFLFLSEDNEYNILDFNGNKILEKDYDLIDIAYSYYQYYRVIENNKQGLINKDGNIIIPVRYDKIEFIGTPDVGRLLLQKNDKMYNFDIQEVRKEYFKQNKFFNPAKNSFWNKFFWWRKNN
jgi:hypothetical protein